MYKQLTCQRFVFKIHSSRLREAKWNLTLSISDARINDEVVSVGDSQMLRWIDELNGVCDADILAKNIKKEIKKIKNEPHSFENRSKIKELYKRLDDLQFKADYVNIIMDNIGDYRRAVKG